MNLELNLPAELEARLTYLANQEGLTLNAFAVNALRRAVTSNGKGHINEGYSVLTAEDTEVQNTVWKSDEAARWNAMSLAQQEAESAEIARRLEPNRRSYTTEEVLDYVKEQARARRQVHASIKGTVA